jgi:hypothetical protein
MAQLINGFSLYGITVGVFTMLTLVGIAMSAYGNVEGKDVWQTFGTALTTFVGGNKLGRSATSNQ